VFYNVYRGVLLGGGRDITINNNIFIGIIQGREGERGRETEREREK
jgi:hypothetical protein